MKYRIYHPTSGTTVRQACTAAIEMAAKYNVAIPENGAVRFCKRYMAMPVASASEL